MYQVTVVHDSVFQTNSWYLNGALLDAICFSDSFQYIEETVSFGNSKVGRDQK